MVCGNEGDEAGNDDSTLVLLGNGGLTVVGTWGGVWVRRGMNLSFTAKAKNTKTKLFGVIYMF